jgi:hypothetical protein
LIAAYARQGVTDLICTSHFGADQIHTSRSHDYLARYTDALTYCSDTFFTVRVSDSLASRIGTGTSSRLVPVPAVVWPQAHRYL